MNTVNRSALVPYSTAQMYELVKDVESYPHFLPWCSGARVHELFKDGVVASIDVSKGVLRQSFTTRNRFVENSKISMQLENGSFSELKGAWSFVDVGTEGSRVSLYLQFDFSSTLARVTIGSVFHKIADRLVDAFVERSQVIYG